MSEEIRLRRDDIFMVDYQDIGDRGGVELLVWKEKPYIPLDKLREVYKKILSYKCEDNMVWVGHLTELMGDVM